MASAPLDMHQMALESVPVALVVTNPALADNPIVFVNRAFSTLTGYAPDVCIGRNCRFLQGEETDRTKVAEMRRGIEAGQDVSVELLNYRSDGTTFLNQIYIAPLRDEAGAIQFFIGLQRPVATLAGAEAAQSGVDTALREIHHRVKNHLSMVVGMIRMQARADNANSLENYATLARRIETLQLLYQEMTTGGTQTAQGENISLGAYVSRIASTIAYLDGRESVRLNVDVDNLRAPVDLAAQVGLLVSELLTNAYQHAFDRQEDGLVEVRLQALSNGGLRLQVSDDGKGLPQGSQWPDTGALGGKIVRSLLTGLGAEFSSVTGRSGSVFNIDVPADRISEQRSKPPAEAYA